jgi:2-polyprenyl-3-methyl-5-hydroxy-6-metoxy-1,4-benzoquinol methylase
LRPTGTHDWSKFITPDELRAMVENSELDDGKRLNLMTQRGIVLQPRDPVKQLLRCAPPVEWALSATDLDVNYITHFLKL